MGRPEECTSAFLHPLIRTIMTHWFGAVGEVTAGLDLWPLLSGALCWQRGSRFSQPLQGGRLSGKSHPDSPRTRLGREEREETGLGQCGTHISSESEWDAPPQGPDWGAGARHECDQHTQTHDSTRANTHTHTDNMWNELHLIMALHDDCYSNMISHNNSICLRILYYKAIMSVLKTKDTSKDSFAHAL